MPVFLIGMVLLLAGAIVYVGLRAIRWLRTMFDFKRTYILWVVLVLLPLLFVFGDMLSASAFARAVTITGGVAIGVFLYILLFTAAADLIALLLRRTPISRKPAFRSRRTLRAVGCIVLALGVCVSAYGVINAATVDRTTYDVSLTGSGTDGLKIALISDLHLGSEIGSAQMRRAVDEINACKADVVIIAGDVFNADVEDCYDLDEAAAELRRIDSRLGVYAVLGNHDPAPDYPPLQAFFESAGIRLLDDEAVSFPGFTLVGRAESASMHGDGRGTRKSLEELLDGSERGKPVLVVDHRPAGVDEAVAFGADLIMCGHTHRGQIFPANLIAAWTHGSGRNYGHTVEGNTDVIVTSGVGYWGAAAADRQRRRGRAHPNRPARLKIKFKRAPCRHGARFVLLGERRCFFMQKTLFF